MGVLRCYDTFLFVLLKAEIYTTKREFTASKGIMDRRFIGFTWEEPPLA